jgi:plasmid stabilization system protein ParE
VVRPADERPSQQGADEALAYNRALLDAALGLVRTAAEAGLRPRLLGGLAIAAHLPDPASFSHRKVNDVDIFVARSERRQVAQLMVAAGYEPETRFNALNGHRRMLFHATDFDIDVLVGQFDMCHRLDLEPRIDLDKPTLPVADLLLTKLQIVELNEKDAVDVVLLVESHELGSGPGDHVDLQRIVDTTATDWGLWRTIHLTTERVLGVAPPIVRTRLEEMLVAIDASPKSLGWRARARIGDRKRWYQIPEEMNP